MEDFEIRKLFLNRSETAVSELSEKYEKICKAMVKNILQSTEDAEECFNSALLAVWNSVPPSSPENLGGYFLKTARNIALNRLKYLAAEKRGGGNAEIALSELEETLSGDNRIEEITENGILIAEINRFLKEISEEKRTIFVKRYWYLYSVSDIAEDLKISESKVKSVLFRTRKFLKKRLEKEGLL